MNKRSWIFKARARSDPSLEAGVRGDPQTISNLRVDPSELFGSRGDPPEVMQIRREPPADSARGKPPYSASSVSVIPIDKKLIKKARVSVLVEGSIIGLQKEPQERGVPGQEGGIKPLSGFSTTERVKGGVTPFAVIGSDGRYRVKKLKDMKQTVPLEYGHFYHIYNRGIDSCDLFWEPDNYEHFLGLYDKYVSQVADTFAWVLMPNHFHLLVKVKEEKEIGFILQKPLSGFSTTERVKGDATPSVVIDPDGGWIEKKYKPENQFSHLFNSYAQAFNKRYGRTGSLFQHPFKRKLISNEKYMRQVIMYIHNNPVHHGFCSHPSEYGWSSYLSCISIKPTKLKRESVMGWFDSLANFKIVHNEKVEIEKIERWLSLSD